jgi:hypothetical protein
MYRSATAFFLTRSPLAKNIDLILSFVYECSKMELAGLGFISVSEPCD